MGSITINFEDKQLDLLKEKAKELQMASVEQLLLKLALEFLESREAKFETAMRYVLEKNKELYKRLA